MRHLLVMLVVGLFTLGPALDYAEARRLGGGGNVGSFSRSADRPAATPNQATPARQGQQGAAAGSRMPGMLRSEERRVGKECRSRGTPCGYKRQKNGQKRAVN